MAHDICHMLPPDVWPDTIPAMRWDSSGWGEWRYVDVSGRITGRIKRRFDFEYEAYFNDKPLGRYINQETAQLAVLNAYTSQYGFCSSALKKNVP